MKTKLRKELGFLDVFSIAAGAMIGAGLFILPSLAYAKCGPGVFLSYILAAFFVLPAMLSKAELTTAMPKAGGTYFFIDRSLGAPMGTLGGISSWFSLSMKSAFALVGLGIFFEVIMPDMSYDMVKLIAIGFLLVFMTFNILGVKMAGRAQAFMVVILMGILVFYIIAGLKGVKLERFSPFVPEKIGTLFSTAGFIFISYGGLTKIASVAEEVRNPGKTIPLAMFAAWLLVGLLYGGVVFVTIGLLEPETMRSTHIPIALGAKAAAGKTGLALLSLAGILAVVTTANAGILSASRSPLAMARDNLLPPFFCKINKKFGTPHYSILFTGLFMLLVIVFLDLYHLVEVASTLMIILFMLDNVSVIVMRESRMSNYRPQFKSPLYPWIQIAGIIGPLFLLLEFGLFPLLVTVIFLVGALIFYYIYAHPRTSRESGLIYIIEKLVSRHLSKGTLRKELKEIIMERDEIVEDQFDTLVKNCEVLDIKESIDFDDLFKRVSETLSERIKISEQEIYRLLWERERDSSTVITPTLAVPHIIIPGEKKFDIVLVRCVEGLVADMELPPINTVFVLIGTEDQRSYHLKALAAIAHIAQDPEFENNWMKAGSVEDLRDVLHLAQRKRF
ncbi:amino acid permease [Verrucomicrobiota bacterium]